MIFVYRRSNSAGARELADALGAARVKRFEGGNFYRRRLGTTARPLHPRRGDLVVCWGEAMAPLEGVTILNGANLRTKFEDATRLREAGVSTIQVSRTRPAAAPAQVTVDPAVAIWTRAQELAGAFTGLTLARTPPMMSGVADLEQTFSRLRVALSIPFVAPLPQADATWLPRMNSHVGGADLLRTPPNPDYFSKKETLVREYRVHVFQGRSIRAGQKVLRDGFSSGAGAQAASSWIRSYDGGWRIVYDDFESSRAMRDLAFASLEALSLDFGAIDIGQKADGSLIVLECNRAPGLEGGTTASYATAITSLLEQSTIPAQGQPGQPARRAA